MGELLSPTQVNTLLSNPAKVILPVCVRSGRTSDRRVPYRHIRFDSLQMRESEYNWSEKVESKNAMASKTKKQPVGAPVISRRRKTKFQADLAPAEDRTVRLLKDELQLTSNTDFLSDALALFRWAVSERKMGHRIVSESASGDRKVLVFPRLERVAPDLFLPRVEIKWTERELESLAKLVSDAEADPPTEALVRALRD